MRSQALHRLGAPRPLPVMLLMPCRTPLAVAAASLLVAACASPPDRRQRDRIEPIVDAVVTAIMAAHDIPGMAVAVTIDAHSHTFPYGLASRVSGSPVTEHTLFEIGSISKVFTATLACEAATNGALCFDHFVSRYLPELAGSTFDSVRVLDLGTYTAGGLPLQFPDDVEHTAAYFANWRPEYAAGTHRLYSNPSLGLFGEIAARSLGTPFDVLMEQRLLPQLGLRETHLQVPAERMQHYADGHDKAGNVTRLSPGPLSAPTYGLKTTARDLLQFVAANIDATTHNNTLQQAIAATHVRYYEVGGMSQGLGWEMYEDPDNLDTLLAGNSPNVIFAANAVTRPVAPHPAGADWLYNKTGSTNGFGAYVAFVPERRIGVVLLANKSFPIAARVAAAHRILMALGG